MSEGEAKVKLILELKERLKTGFSKAKETVNSNVREMKNKIASLRQTHVEAFRAMRDEIPIFGRSMQLLGNPFILLTAGLLAMTGLLGKGVSEAARFNHEFTNIRNLNLDKNKTQMDAYKKSIYNVAMETGQDSALMAKGFYDIQSATGLFGKDVEAIAKKVGNYSIATGAQLPDAINQTTKAMKAFGLGVKDIDGLLTSNAKTVQMGIVTFDELAKVQTEYGGAAAGAGQNVDTANKVFAAFTSIAKNAETAATMTKGAFEGLTQKQTIDGLNSIGVSMYDAKGNMRDMSIVLREVSERFKRMRSQEVDELINKIGGPEGLRALFVKLKTGAGDFFALMDNYDSTKFNLDKALANAKGDFTTLKMIVGQQFNTVMAQLGEKFLPMIAKGMQTFSGWLQTVYNNWEPIMKTLSWIAPIILGIVGAWKLWTTAQYALNFAMSLNPIGALVLAIGALVGGIIAAYNYFEKFRGVVWGVWESIKTFVKGIKEGVMDVIMGMVNVFKGLGTIIKSIFDRDWNGIKKGWEDTKAGFSQAAGGILDAVPITSAIKNGKKIGESFSKGYADGVQNFRDEKAKKKAGEEAEQTGGFAFGQPADGDVTNAGGGINNGGGTLPKPLGAESINGVTGAATQSKNITVNIDSFVKGLTVNNGNTEKMGESQIEAIIREHLMRVVTNLQVSY